MVYDSSTEAMFEGVNSGVVFSVEFNSFLSEELVRARGLRHT